MRGAGFWAWVPTTVPTPCLIACTGSSPRRVTPARPSAVPGSGTPHGDTLKPLRRTCGREAARPEIRPERQNCVPGYTRREIWGIWSMAADEIRWGIEYQGENQKNNGLAGSRLTDSGVSLDSVPLKLLSQIWGPLQPELAPARAV